MKMYFMDMLGGSVAKVVGEGREHITEEEDEEEIKKRK